MLKLLIVDDEQIICKGLRLTIPWEEHNIKVVGEAYNGFEALDIINKHSNIDIVLTDVRMPKMDGLQLVKELQEYSNKPRIIIISGHDEFQYAKKAMGMGVKDYLLKPIKIDELLKTVTRVKSEIMEERSNLASIHELKLKDKITHKVFGTPLKYAKINDQDNLSFVYPIMSSMQITLKEYFKKDHFLKLKIDWIDNIDKVFNTLGIKGFSFFVESNVLLTIIYDWTNKPSTYDLERVLPTVIQKLPLNYLLTNNMIPLKSFPTVYQKLSVSLDYLFTNQSSFLVVDNVRTKYSNSIINVNHHSEKVIESFVSAQKSELINRIKKIFHSFRQQKVTLGDAIVICQKIEQNVLDRYNKLVRNLNLKLENSLLKDRNIELSMIPSYSLLQDLFEKDLFTIYGKINYERKNSNYWVIDRAIEYIHEFYNMDIKSSEIADYLNISPNYFSTIFKQQKGASFNEYLNTLRIEKAKVLLEETSDKVSIISDLVGYQDYKYFVKIFRDITNMTPTKYRNIISNYTNQTSDHLTKDK